MHTGTSAQVAALRVQGHSVRAISERTGIPRSTVGDRVVALGSAARPEHVVGRDGRHYRPVREPRDATAEALRQALLDAITRVPTGPTSRDGRDRALPRLLVVDQLRTAARSVADAAPFSDTEREVIGRYLMRIGRGAGLSRAAEGAEGAERPGARRTPTARAP